MVSFHEVRFPELISWGATGGPRFKTNVVMFDSGKEQRDQKWELSRASWDAVHGVRDQNDLDELIDFFRARRGRAFGFRFKDWTDYQLIDEPLQNTADSTFVGDGVELDFNTVRQYEEGGPNVEVRRLRKLRGGTGDPLTILVKAVKLDGVPQTEGVDFTIDYDTGIITFTVAPGVAVVPTITIEFDIPARFDTDEMRMTIEDFNATTWGQIKIVEINLEANP